MQVQKLLFEYSPWFILVCIIIGIGYAYLLYSKSGPWSQTLNRILFAVRFILVTILCILFLSPLLKQVKNSIEEPIYVIAIDNSSSVSQIMDTSELQQLKTELQSVAQYLEEKNHQIEVRTLNEKMSINQIQQINFDQPMTHLSETLRDIQNDYEGRNLGGVLLISDGIYNQGISPAYIPYNFEISTLGLGDTIPKNDINLRNLIYNRIAYQGNRYPLIAELVNNGFAGKQLTVNVSMDGKVVASENLQLTERNSYKSVQFLIEAKKKGLKHLIVSIEPQDGEFTTENNVKHAYIDILGGREKILILAPAPHPDIKAIRSAIESNKNYETHLWIPGIIEPEQSQQGESFDLAILHQLPEKQTRFNDILNDRVLEDAAKWYIVGSKTNLVAFNRANPIISISNRGFQTDKVTPYINKNFELFTLEEDIHEIVEEYPPVTVPFGDYTLKRKSEILLYQKVGRIGTSKPLLVFQEFEGKKSAVMMGEGIWKWRMNEYALHQQHTVFNTIITKLVQYLSTKEDRRKFRVYPIENQVNENMPVVLKTETYNDLYENIYGNKVDLIITNERGETYNYSYVTSELNDTYKVSGLEQGIYNFSASTVVQGNRETSSGEFTIRELQVEQLNLTANHQLLKRLSYQTGGYFFNFSEIPALRANLESRKARGIIHTEEEFLPIINLRWILALLILLVSMEWFVRKYSGGY